LILGRSVEIDFVSEKAVPQFVRCQHRSFSKDGANSTVVRSTDGLVSAECARCSRDAELIPSRSAVRIREDVPDQEKGEVIPGFRLRAGPSVKCVSGCDLAIFFNCDFFDW
jgi:hypothetical protein